MSEGGSERRTGDVEAVKVTVVHHLAQLPREGEGGPTSIAHGPTHSEDEWAVVHVVASACTRTHADTERETHTSHISRCIHRLHPWNAMMDTHSCTHAHPLCVDTYVHIHIHIHTHMYLHTTQGRHMGIRTSLCCEQSGRGGDQDTHSGSWGLDDNKIETALSQQNPTHKPPTSGQHRHSLTCWEWVKRGRKDRHAPAGGATAAVAHTHIHTYIEDTRHHHAVGSRISLSVFPHLLSHGAEGWGT